METVDGELSEIVHMPEVELYEKDVTLIVERSVKNINAANNPRDFLHADIEKIIKRSFKVL